MFGIDYETAQRILQIAALACALCAGGVVAAVVGYEVFKPLLVALSRLWRRSRVECVAAVAALGFVVAWGGSKGTITFPRTNAEYELLKDAGSFILTAGDTNKWVVAPMPVDIVTVAFTTHALVPDTADVQMWRRPIASTNDADWVMMRKTTVADTAGQGVNGVGYALGGDYPAHTATNYDWVVFTSWQPAPAVQTNGVLHVDWMAQGNGEAGREAAALHAVPSETTVEAAGYAQNETGAVDFVKATFAPTSAMSVETMPEEEYWYRAYAPNTALRIDLNYNAEGDNSFGLVIWPPRNDTVVTVDWGDGTTTVTNSGSTADYLLEHAYAERKEYVVQIGDTLLRPLHFYRLRYGYKKNWPNAVKNFMRWGDSAQNAYESLLYCYNCEGMTPRWPEGMQDVAQAYWQTKMTGPIPPWPKNCWGRDVYQSNKYLRGAIPEWGGFSGGANNTYYGCTGLTGTIPPWGEKVTDANSTYYGCTGLTGAIPPWNNVKTAKSTYRNCTGLTGAWTTDPDELMPTNIAHDAYVVAGASPELRALFYPSWGGTRPEPEGE